MDSTASAVVQALTIFVPGKLSNPLNSSHGHWSKRARWAKQWRERTHLVWMEKYQRRGDLQPMVPKLIRVRAHVWSLWDQDNLRAGLKPVVDALTDIGLIVDDGPQSGHQFVYGQVIDRTRRGVEITVEPRTACEAEGDGE